MVTGDALRRAIQTQGEQLNKRAEWLRKMVEQAGARIESSQRTLDHFAAELHAVELSIDSLRDEYKHAIQERADD